MRRLKRTLTVVAMFVMAINANAYRWQSPYAYCNNNPVKFIDLDGMRSYNIIGTDGNNRTEIINDGIDETYDIHESDYTLLAFAYNQDMINEGSKSYEALFNSLGLGTKGYEVALKARELAETCPDKYAYNQDAGDGFGPGVNKCNKFVYDVLTTTDALTINIPPLAAHYAGETCIVNGEFVSMENYQPRLGDVISGVHKFQNASGHLEIVTRVYPSQSQFDSVGAHSKGAYTSNMGYKMVNGLNCGSRNSPLYYNPVKVSRPN